MAEIVLKRPFGDAENAYRGVARIFQRGGVTDKDTIRGSPTIYGLHRCFPSCISGLSRIITAWRPILTKDKSRWRKYFTKKPNFKKVGLSTMAFTAKILSGRFCHLNIVGCLLKRRPTKGGSRAPQDPPPLLRPWYVLERLSFTYTANSKRQI